MTIISLLLADDHAVVRDGLKALLEMQADMTVVGAVQDGREAVSEAARLSPNVAVLDISMPGMNGIEAAGRMHAQSPSLGIIMLSMHDNSEHVHRALDAGASGYLLKDSAGAELVAAVRAVHAGRRYLCEKINNLVISGYLGGHRGSPLDSLSKRELDILQNVVEGRSNMEVARELCISVKTVETYRSRMMHKLALKDLPSLVKFAIEHGLTQLN